MKTCTKCGVEKPITDFVKDIRLSSGIRARCKTCSNTTARRSQQLRVEKFGYVKVSSKVCSTCKASFPATEFNKKPGTPDGLQPMCKGCKKVWNREQRLKKLVENPGREIDAHLRKTYKISFEDYLEMERRQDSKCAVCGTTDSGTYRGLNNTKSRFCIDHDHVTGKIRGLLCLNCNTGIGRLGDNLEGVEAAAAYLRKNNNG